MKYIKQYESKTYPQLGDFIIVKNNRANISWADNFTNNNIGQIVKILDYDKYFYCLVKYDIKFDIYDASVLGNKSSKYKINKGSFQFTDDEDGCRKVRLEDIDFFSKNKSDVEIYITSSKYNL